MSRATMWVFLVLSLVLVGCAAPAASPSAGSTTPVAAAAPNSGPTTAPAAAAPTAAPAAAPGTKGTIRYFDLNNIDVRDVPMLLALDDLKAQGYDLQVTYLAENPLIVEALVRGDADIVAVNNQTMWTAISKGTNARTIGEALGTAAVLVTSSEIKTCADLDGKKVAVPSPTTLTAKLLDEWQKKNCPNAKLQYLTVQANDARNAGLLKGELDAALVQSEALPKIDKDAPGKFHILVSIPKEFPQVRVEGLHVQQEWGQKNPELVKAFLRAVVMANRRIDADPALLTREAASRIKLDDATAKVIGDSYLQLNLWDPNAGLTNDKVQSTLDELTRLGVVPAGLKVDGISDLSYLNAVLAEAGRQ